MVLCGHCIRNCPETIDRKSGAVSCGVCGKVCGEKLLIDDDAAGYLNTKQEYSYKKIMWEAMNKDYLREQSEKQRYGIVKKRSTDQKRRRRQQRRIRDASPKAAAAAEATKKKRLSSKIDYDALDKLFDEEDPLVVRSGKRMRIGVESENQLAMSGEVPQENGDDRYEADTEKCNDGEEEEQENGEGEEEEDTEEWNSRNEEEGCELYGYDDEGDDECW